MTSWSRLAALSRRQHHAVKRHVSGLETPRSSVHGYPTSATRKLSSRVPFKNDPIVEALSLRIDDILNHPWLVPRKGSGFDNFFPKNKKNSDETSSKKEGTSDGSSKENADDKSSSSFNSKKEGGGAGGGNGSGPGGNPRGPTAGQIAANLAVSLFIIYLAARFQGDEVPSEFASREITWQDLVNHLLEKGQVEKIVVTNNRTMAKVFLKPGAPGLPIHQSRLYRYSERRQQGTEVAFEDSPEETFSTSSTSSSTNDSFSSSSTSPNNQRPHQIIYRLPVGSIDAFEKKLEDAQKAVGSNEIPVQYTADSTVGSEIMGVLPSLVMMGAMFMFFRFASGSIGGSGMGQGGRGGGMGGMFQVGKSTAKKISKEDVKINFSNVAGCEEAKKEVMEFVDFLKDASRFTKLGAKIPKGALLCGPPGTGKTLLAKAVAGEAGVPFYSISGSDFIEMFVGVGPSRVRDLFKEARENSPCIIFIDEIDAVGRQRGRGNMGGNDERENTLNQLLVEMDGFEPSTGVVVLAGTNRVDILDQALTRPGRFDRQITVDKPDLNGRKEIFKVHLKGITLSDSVDEIAGRLAGLTPGFAGADIANVCNEAAIVAARRNAETVSMEDFEAATDRIIGGLESNKIMSLEERNVVAHHEAGHAVAGWFLEHADPLMKVTIIPRSSGALGFAQYLPKEVFLRTQDQIMDIVCMALAGRAAEEIFFGKVTTGASDDLRRVTDLVYSTIQVYGMNPRLGQLAFPKDPNAMFDERQYSEKTARAMDEEAKQIVDDAYQRTLDLLHEHKDDVEKVAHLLLEKETITHDDITDIVGPRPFQGDSAYQEFVSRRTQVKKEMEKEKKEENKDEATEEETLNPGLAFKIM